MKNKFVKTLAGIVLATSLSLFQNCSVQKGHFSKQERNYLNGNLPAKAYNINLNQDKYKIGGIVFFDKKGQRDQGYIPMINTEIDEAELEFILSPQNETGIVFSQKGTTLVPNEYIPTKVVNKKGKDLNVFESRDPEIRAKLSKQLKNKTRKTSENFVGGYTYELNETDIKAIFPGENINGIDYMYLNSNKGYFLSEEDGKLKRYQLTPNQDRINLLLIPTDQNIEAIANLENGIITVYTDRFYNPVTERLQAKKSDFKKEKPKKETDYMKYRKEKEKKTCGKKEIPKKDCCTYVVKPCNTLSKLSKKFYKGIPISKGIEKIMNSNPQIKDKNKIYVGQKLRICFD